MKGRESAEFAAGYMEIGTLTRWTSMNRAMLVVRSIEILVEDLIRVLANKDVGQR